MINKVAIVGLLALILSGCGTIPFAKNTQTLADEIGDKILTNVLNSKPDGYVGTIASSDKTYKINSTRLSNSGIKLCRILSIGKNNAFRIETYCKMKGGNWQ